MRGDGRGSGPGGGRLFRHGTAQPQAGTGQRHPYAAGGGERRKRRGECSQRGIPDLAGAGVVHGGRVPDRESGDGQRGYADCVVFMGEDSVSVVVAAPETGLNTADVARIKDIVVNETDYTPEQIKIMEAN